MRANSEITRQHREAGFTLIELMVALVIGSLLVIGILAIFIYGNRSYREDDQVAKMQDELRFAMSQITRDLEMAGFWASLLDPAEVTLDADLSIASDCGPETPLLPALEESEPADSPRRTWIYGNLEAIAFVNDASPSESASVFPCLDEGEVGAGNPDVIAIKRLASELSYQVAESETDGLSNNSAPDEMMPGQVYVQSNNSKGLMFALGGGIPSGSPVPPYEYWRYRPTIYYIRSFTDQAGDGIPSLCRKILSLGAAATGEESESEEGEGGGEVPALVGAGSTQCLATGIEDLQLEFGIDRNGDAAPEFYDPDPTPDDLRLAVAVRVTLLARSERRGEGYTNRKAYALTSEKTVTPNDRFYRRTLTTTVLLRNPAALRTY